MGPKTLKVAEVVLNLKVHELQTLSHTKRVVDSFVVALLIKLLYVASY